MPYNFLKRIFSSIKNKNHIDSIATFCLEAVTVRQRSENLLLCSLLKHTGLLSTAVFPERSRSHTVRIQLLRSPWCSLSPQAKSVKSACGPNVPIYHENTVWFLPILEYLRILGKPITNILTVSCSTYSLLSTSVLDSHHTSNPASAVTLTHVQVFC